MKIKKTRFYALTKLRSLYSLITDKFPLWCRRSVYHKEAVVTLHAAGNCVLHKRMLTGGMAALQTTKSKLHIRKWWIGITIRTQWVTLQGKSLLDYYRDA